VKIFTIGFTKTSAEDFFGRLERASVKAVVDVRLKSESQLSGFAKGRDLEFFLKELIGVSYERAEILAPTAEMLTSYQRKEIGWNAYAERYLELLEKRGAAKNLSDQLVGGVCLLCSEHLPHHCHRRLAADYLRKTLNIDLEVMHL
jgi:uncharacterized protein (DUF488 family)